MSRDPTRFCGWKLKITAICQIAVPNPDEGFTCRPSQTRLKAHYAIYSGKRDCECDANEQAARNDIGSLHCAGRGQQPAGPSD